MFFLSQKQYLFLLKINGTKILVKSVMLQNWVPFRVVLAQENERLTNYLSLRSKRSCRHKGKKSSRRENMEYCFVVERTSSSRRPVFSFNHLLCIDCKGKWALLFLSSPYSDDFCQVSFLITISIGLFCWSLYVALWLVSTTLTVQLPNNGKSSIVLLANNVTKSLVI